MGTNIHGWIEAAVPYPGQNDEVGWCAAIPLDLAGGAQRDYRVFSGLFGVCTPADGSFHVRPIAPSRGLPDNASGTVYVERNEFGPDGHSETWISARELLGAPWAVLAPFPERWTGFRDVVTALARVHGPDRVRIVVWFDN